MVERFCAESDMTEERHRQRNIILVRRKRFLGLALASVSVVAVTEACVCLESRVAPGESAPAVTIDRPPSVVDAGTDEIETIDGGSSLGSTPDASTPPIAPPLGSVERVPMICLDFDP